MTAYNSNTNSFDIREFSDKLTHVKGEKYICPVCDNNNLSISKKTGAYQCWSGCQNKDIREAVAPRESNIKPIRPASNISYFYNDRQGKPCVKVTRIDDGEGHKKFPQSAWDGRKWQSNLDGLDRSRIPCYRYQEVKAAIEQGNPIFICEGEGCADALWDLGIAATTFIGGSGNYRKYGSYQQDLEGASLVLCPDRDVPGLSYMEEVSTDFPNAQWCYAPPSDFFWMRLPQNRGLDIKDWIASGATAAQILEAVGSKKNLKPETAKVINHPSSYNSPSISDIGSEIDSLINKDLRRYDLLIETAQLAQRYKTSDHTILKIYNARVEELDREEVRNESEIRFETICRELEKLEEIEANENPAYQEWEMKRLAKKWGFRTTKELLDFHAKILDNRHRKGEKLTYGLTEYFEKFADSSTDWLIRGWIPNKVVTVLHAAGGVGKTRLVSSICRALIAGKSWSGYDVETPVCVLFVETDQGSPINIQMFDEQGYLDEPEEVRSRLRINDDWNINQYGRLKAMLNAFRETHPDSKILVVIDSLTTVSVKATFSENDQEFARPLVRFRAIAEEFSCSFLVLHHSNRSGECRGTTAIFNAADQVFKLERSDPKNAAGPLDLNIQKTRNRAPGRYRLNYDENTWTWEIIGRLEADDSIADNYGTVQKSILDYVKAHPGVGFEAEELSHLLGISQPTCRKELATLVREALISAVRQGRPKKVYFVGQLMSTKGVTAPPFDPFDPFDPLIREKNNDSEKNEKIADQTDQTDQTLPSIGLSADQTSDQNGSNGSNVTEVNNHPINVTVNVPEVIVEPKIGDELVNKAGVAIAKVEKVSSYFILLRSLIDKDLCGKLNKDGLWVASSKQFRHWKELLQLQLKREAIASESDTPVADCVQNQSPLVEEDAIAPEVDKALCPGCESFDAANRKCDRFNIVWKKSEQLIKEGECDHFQENAIAPPDEPDWQPGDKLLMSVFGSAKKYEVEFVRFTWLEDGTYKAIVLLEGKEVEWNVDMLSRPGGQL